MNFKQKLIYMGVGFLFASMGYLLATHHNTINAQNAPIQPQVIDQIICRRLRIVEPHGKTVLELHARNEHGGQLTYPHCLDSHERDLNTDVRTVVLSC